MKRVYLYTRGASRAHPIYQELSRYAPEGFYFTPPPEDFFAPRPSLPPAAASRFVSLAESQLLKIFIACGIPKIRLIRVPRGTAVVHSGQCPIANRVPWVMDFEQAAAITWFNRNLLDSSLVKNFFEHIFAREECKGLLAWTGAAKKSLLNAIDCSSFADKIKVAHLTIVPQKYVNRATRAGAVKILFCSGNFYHKGGLDAALAAVEIAKHYDINLTVVSETPIEVLRRFEKYPRVVFRQNVNVEERHALMREADIFIHPGHSETYGFVMLEAFSFGLPVVSTDGYSAPELVENGTRGYVVKNYLSLFDDKFLPQIRGENDRRRFYEMLTAPPPDYINRLALALAKLIENKGTRLDMGNRAYQSVTEGIFSPAQRKKVMKQIYESAIS